MSKIQLHILKEVETHGYYKFQTTYDAKNGRYKGVRTSKAAKELQRDGKVIVHEVWHGITKYFTVSRTSC